MSEHAQISEALERLSARRSDPGGGAWLEEEVAAFGSDISEWDLEAERVAAGDWTTRVWRSP